MSRLSLILAVALVSAAPVGIASSSAADAPVTLSTRGVDFSNQAQVEGPSTTASRWRLAPRATAIP